MKRSILMIAMTAAAALSQVKLPGKLSDKLTGKPAAPAPAPAESGQSTVSGTVKNQTVEFTLTTTSKRASNDVVATNPSKVFPFAGARSNVFAVLRFTPPLQGAASVKVTILKNGSFEDDRDVEYLTGGRSGYVNFTLKPGAYDVEIADKFNTSAVYVRDHFTVTADTVGDRAVGNIKSGSGTLQICKDVVELNCVGETYTWKAGVPFTAFVTMKEPTGVSNTTWVIYKQKPDGTDGQFMNDIMQPIEPTYKRWFAGDFNLPAGTYTVYSVYSQTNQSSEKSGNLKEYFAKTTLVVK